MVAASIVAGGKKTSGLVSSCRTLFGSKIYLYSLADTLTRTNQGVNAITFQIWRSCQTVKDILTDLKNLKERLPLEELARTFDPHLPQQSH